MKKITRILSVIILIAMLVAILIPNAAAAPSAWAAEAVSEAVALGLVPPSMQARYTESATRAEFCALAVALYEAVEGEITGRITFTDTDDAAVEKAAYIGVVNGVVEGVFAPDNTLTREQAAVMLARLLGAVGRAISPHTMTFADMAQVSDWATAAVGQMQISGIMGGVGENRFSPRGAYTIEQSIVTVLRAYKTVAVSGFTVYFIDVGQADSALVLCDGAAMLIDGGNAADSSLIYAFLKERGISHLDYIVATHAHEDHVGGLAGALNFATAGVALAPVTSYDTKVFGNFISALESRGLTITVPSAGDKFKLGSADVAVLGPTRPSDESNNTSIVLKITYGATSFLFTGDAERAEEADILEAGYDLSATVLKVGHHGSDTSTTYPFLREIMPQYAVISCGANNSYGHPHDGPLSRLRDADVTLFRTDMQGTITCTSDGSTVAFSVEKNANAETNPSVGSVEAAFYIGNVNSKKFHRPDCSGLPLEKNRIEFATRAEAIAAGYEPCKNCNP